MEEVLAVSQQGQVFKLRTKGSDGQALWAYRYRIEGRGSMRPQVGGFATRAEALQALRKVLDRLGPGGGAATTTRPRGRPRAARPPPGWSIPRRRARATACLPKE